jgi:putative tricarboxylic transport membrane protein
MLFQTHLSTIYAIYISIIFAYIITLTVQVWGIRMFVRVLRVPPHLLSVCILVMCVLGSYAIRNSLFDVYLMSIMGLLGYILLRLHIPIAPVVLGLVLGGTLETQYRTALILGEGSYQGFIDSKVAVFFFGLIIVTLSMQAWTARRKRLKA